ncbi:MAG: imidazolonepropionase [Saprospiraceae bacterium]|uniref:Imidazolonepropionase n=1 Tax=Candidatus Opimibacter skivensis TaxID=2982028 RepID=A0A9D7SVE9_9BACT|nr:imidazolonepropionase [Candidatus Opimibacter skivensis]
MLLRRISLLTGIQPKETLRLKGIEMSNLPSLPNAYLLIEEGKIKSYGPDTECPFERADQIIDCSGKIVLPSFCDSHTHLVFAAWRANEFVDRIKGMTYEEIANKGGGILNSALKLQEVDEDILFEEAKERLSEVISLGTGAIEIKSGYGLTVESELKMLRVIRRLKELNWIPVKSTFLGAHAVPTKYKNNRKEYIRLIIEEMLPVVRDQGLADYMDVFCDKGFYTVEETDQLLDAGTKYGLKAKIHANELDYSGGIQVGIKHKAVSVDHLEYTGPEEIKALTSSDTIAGILPSTAFFLGLPYAPARKMIESGLCISLASDFNPGTSPSGNMAFILSLACIKMKMTPEEAINAATINGAAAIELSINYGSITNSKSANLLITKPVSNIDFLPYSYGHSWIDKVIVGGKLS